MKKNTLKVKIFYLIFFIFFISCSNSEEELIISTQKGRQVLIYMVADNNLDYFAIDDINEMEKGLLNSHNPSGELLVFVDRNDNGNPSHPYLMRIVPDSSDQVVSEILKVYSEQNTTNGDFFSNVFKDIDDLTDIAFESKGLVMWSHGNAWLPPGISLYSDRDIILDDNTTINSVVKSFGFDETTNDATPHSEMDIIEMADILSEYKFDFILFDACFMGSIEVLYELKDVCDYIISSPTEILSKGFPYDLIVDELLSENFNAINVAQRKVDFYKEQNGILSSSSVSVVETENLHSLASFFREKLPQSINEIDISTPNTLYNVDSLQQFDRLKVEYLFDMNDFVQRICNSSHNETKQEFNILWDKTVIMSDHTPSIFGTLSLENCNGVSMYIPQNYETRTKINEYYKNYKWYEDSNMGNMFNFL